MLGAPFVVIEAVDITEAVKIAIFDDRSPIYFDGVSTGNDCDCCGDRWVMEPYDESLSRPEYNEETLYILKEFEEPDKSQLIMDFIYYTGCGVSWCNVSRRWTVDRAPNEDFAGDFFKYNYEFYINRIQDRLDQILEEQEDG